MICFTLKVTSRSLSIWQSGRPQNGVVSSKAKVLWAMRKFSCIKSIDQLAPPPHLTCDALEQLDINGQHKINGMATSSMFLGHPIRDNKSIFDVKRFDFCAVVNNALTCTFLLCS